MRCAPRSQLMLPRHKIGAPPMVAVLIVEQELREILKIADRVSLSGPAADLQHERRVARDLFGRPESRGLQLEPEYEAIDRFHGMPRPRGKLRPRRPPPPGTPPWRGFAKYVSCAYTAAVTVTFDPKKNAANLKKHGVSLAEGDGVLNDRWR